MPTPQKRINTLYRDLKIIRLMIKLLWVIIMRVSLQLASCYINWPQQKLKVMQEEAPERGLQGSNWRQNKLHCCGIPPPTHSPHSHLRTLVIYFCLSTVYMCVISVHLCVCVCFPLVTIMYSSSLPLLVTPLLSFSQSLPPCFDLFLLFSPTRSQSQKQAHAPIYPPTHAVGTGEYPTSSAVWCGVMQRNSQIGAVPLPNGVSMATKGARPCNSVSNQHCILNLSKNMSCV